MRALLVLALAALIAMPADAARKTPSTRLSSQATSSGAHSVSTVSIPAGTTTAIIAFYFGNGNNNQAPTGVTLDGKTASKIVSNESGGTMQIAVYSATGMATGASKTLAWTAPTGFTVLDIAIEYRDGTVSFGASDWDYCSGCVLHTNALTNANGDEILGAYGVNGSTLGGVGSGETLLDDTLGTNDYGFSTRTGTGTPATLTFTTSAGLASYAAIVVSTSGGGGGGGSPTIPPGYTGTVLTSIAVGSPVDTFNASVTPDIAVGDTMIWPNTTTPSGCVLTGFADGNFEYNAPSGDTSGNCVAGGVRQSASITFWDVSVGALHGDTLAWYDNNHAPVPANPAGSVIYAVPLNSPMTPKSLVGLCTDADGDAPTYTSVDALPTGLSITANVLSGTATVRGITTLTFRCTDVAGDSADFQ